MSNKERAVQLIEELPEYKAGYVVAYLQGLLAADEAEDDAFCEGLYHASLADPDKGRGLRWKRLRPNWGYLQMKTGHKNPLPGGSYGLLYFYTRILCAIVSLTSRSISAQTETIARICSLLTPS